MEPGNLARPSALGFFLLILVIGQIKGQTKYIDSLKHELTISKEDSNKVQLYNSLGFLLSIY